MVEFTSESGSKLRGEWERLCDQAVQYTNEWDTGAYYILLLTQNAKLRRYLSVCSDRSLGRSLGHRVILLAGGAVLHGPPGFVLCWAAYHLVLLVFAVFRIFAVLTLSVLCVEYGFISVVDPSSVAHEQRVGFQPATTFIFYATTTQIYNIAYVLTYDRLNCLTNYVGYLYTSFLVQSTVLSSCYLHVHFQDATN